MRKPLFFVLIVTFTLTLCGIAAHGATVAYWRFDTGPANTPILRPAGVSGYIYTPDILDWSGNGNHLAVWSQGGGAGFNYRTDVANSTVPIEGYTNNFSIKNTGGGPATFTYSAFSNPAGVDIEAMTPLEWTIEASFKPETGGHRTIVGRDGRNVVTGDGNLSILYFKINPDYSVSVAFADVMGLWHDATSTPNIVQGFPFGTDPDGLTGRWYNMAAVSNGTILSLYLNDVASGNGYQIVAQTDMTLSGSSDTRMTRGDVNDTTGDWHTGGWSVGRGLWSGGHVDRAYGYIDEVRISNSALSPEHFLHGPPLSAHQPVPANFQKAVGTATGNGDELAVTLNWNTGMNPADLNAVNPAIATHNLYIGTDPNLPGAPIAIAAGPASTAYPINLQLDKTYYWRVDEITTDANAIAGPVWTFAALKSVPAVTAQPATVVVDAGQQAQFTIEAFSVSTPNYQWFKSADNASNTPADDTPMGAAAPGNQTLTIGAAQISDEAFYYCVVTNPGGQDISAPAGLAIRRLLAHWTLDQADYSNGQYLDVSGEGHHADPNGAPAFVTGQVADGVQIARLANEDPTTASWANAGTWNPSMYSGQMTVAFWLNWAGPNGTWQTLVSKRSGDFSNDNLMWQISTNDNGNDLWLQSQPTLISVGNGLADGIGQWVHIVATTDGANGTIYIDGEQRATGAFRFSNKTDAAICLGGNSFDTGPREWMNGSLDNVRIYNYPISEMDAAILFSSEAPGRTACVQSLKPSANFDLNNDCIVNIEDFGLFAGQWLDCAIVPTCMP